MSLPRINLARAFTATAVGRDRIAMASAADCRVYDRPAGLMHDFGDFLRMAHAAMDRPAEATVAVSGVVDTARDDHAAARGWNRRTSVPGSAWTTYVHDVTGEALHVVDVDRAAEADPSLWLLGLDPAAMAVKLATYHHATGTAFRATPGVSGCALVRRLAAEAADRKTARVGGKPAGQPFWRDDRHPSFLTPMGDLKWTSASLPTSGMVHQMDVRAAYLAAASAARLAWSPVRHTGAIPFDQAAAGYWQITAADVPATLHGGRPYVIDPARVAPDGTVWVTTPIMAYLCSRGINPDVIDSWTCERSGQLLRPWAETLRDALYGDGLAVDDPDVASLVKETYRQTIGMFNRPGGSVYRPDWWATIVDTARMNLVRKIDTAAAATGDDPIRVYVDALYWHTNYGSELEAVAEAVALDGTGRRIGKLRYVGDMSAAGFAERLSPAARRRRNLAAARRTGVAQ